MNLNKWKKDLKNDLEESWLDNTINTDQRTCPSCGGEMNFHGHDDNGDFPLGEGYWECESCGLKVSESDL